MMVQLWKNKPRNNAFSELLPVIQTNENCNFHVYDVENLMKETSQLRKLITKRDTLEILIPLCSNNPVRQLKFRFNEGIQ